MENTNDYQLELFSQTQDSGGIRNQKSGNSFLAFIWGYEKAILIIIGFLITGVISFSLGVEKGKRLTQLKDNSRFDTAAKTEAPAKPIAKQAVIPERQMQQAPINKEEAITQPQPTEKESFTIQLASYKTKSYAQKEAESLKKKGLSPLVLSKGNYIVLCVGSFSNRQAAQPLLTELKKKYQDCRVRRL
jgi:hypothetical protein